MGSANHELPDCFLVWYGPYLRPRDAVIEELCEQGWADFHMDGANWAEARLAKWTWRPGRRK